jgi:mannose-6-phosphate isomerase-like protein (cupin superfamily)
MEYKSVNLKEKLTKFSDLWAPRIVAQFNDYHIKVAKVMGEFAWHNHPDTDELFIVLEGSLEIHFTNGKVKLNAGEIFVVPKNVENKPFAENECQLMLIEPVGTVNTGNLVNDQTAQDNIWI